MTVAGQAALAIDNARLYQQQKDFSETMQRSLLPSALPRCRRDRGRARLPVGGAGGRGRRRVRLPPPRRRAARGRSSATSRARASRPPRTWRWRSSASARSPRMHPEPAEFLAAANEVVVDEIETGKFITMLYVLLDPEVEHGRVRERRPSGRARRHSRRPGRRAGRPRARARDRHRPGVRGRAGPSSRPGRPSSSTRTASSRRAATASSTARSGSTTCSPPRRASAAQELAEAVLADCKSFAGGELSDDCAVVCLRLTLPDGRRPCPSPR